MKPTETYEDKPQTNWETWFVCSVIVFLGSFFILAEAKGTDPNLGKFYFVFIIAIINLSACLWVGTRIPK